ncbi:uncharacterized protein LOC114733222 [Neltuma alba]|uniref:uncharacterized protein LOC114733222 n=1 Tax=Neltuma alba TaxID=207710 RepID=UPI0010A58328|nr:uncharacterized protein LOC114733222 [Prosopis alba]
MFCPLLVDGAFFVSRCSVLCHWMLCALLLDSLCLVTGCYVPCYWMLFALLLDAVLLLMPFNYVCVCVFFQMNCFHSMLRAVKPELFANEDQIDKEVKWAKVYVQNDTDLCGVHVISWLQEWDGTVRDNAGYTMPRYSNDELQELNVGYLWWLVTYPNNEHGGQVMSMLSDYNKTKKRR